MGKHSAVCSFRAKLSSTSMWRETESSTLVTQELHFTALEAGILCQCFSAVWKCEMEESFHAHSGAVKIIFVRWPWAVPPQFPRVLSRATLHYSFFPWSDRCCQLTQKWIGGERKTEWGRRKGRCNQERWELSKDGENSSAGCDIMIQGDAVKHYGRKQRKRCVNTHMWKHTHLLPLLPKWRFFSMEQNLSELLSDQRQPFSK